MKKNVSESENSLPTGYATRWKSLIFVCIALLPLSFDNTILNIALPTLANELNATTHQLQWVTDAYILAFASLLFTSGSIGDRYGRKRIFYIGLVLFGLGSAVVLGVTSMNALIIVRAVLGFAASLIMPTTLSIINVNFPKEERPKALAIWGLVFMAGMLLGPILSGVLLRFFSWQSLFLINVPIVVVAFWGISRHLAESKNESAQRIDIMGAILSSAGLFCLIFGIIEAGLIGWTHPTVILFLALSIIFVAVFIWWEKRTPDPMLPMNLFKNMSLTVASLAMVLLTFSMAGGMFSFSLYMQTVLGYSALQAGLGILPMPIIMMVFTPIGLALMKKAGMKVSIGVGLALVAAGLFYMSWFYGTDTSFLVIVIGQILMASGMSIAMTPATNSIMGAVPTAQSGIGSAMNNTTRELGSALGIAVLGTLINSTYLAGVQHLKDLVPQLSDQALAALSSNIQTAHTYAQTLGGEPGALVIKTADQAFVSGMSNAFTIGGIIMLCICVFTFLALPAKIQQTNLEESGSAQAARVVIIGGGFGGVGLAKLLDQKFSVTLIEKQESFFHNVGALRAAVLETWVDKVFIPYTRLLKRGKIIHGTVSSVFKNQVILEGGESIAFDYLVIASGISYPLPAKVPFTNNAANKQQLQEINALIKGANNIILIGGGPVGIEFAGEILSAYPEKKVTLVHKESGLLNDSFSPELRSKVLAKLQEIGVDVILGETLIPEGGIDQKNLTEPRRFTTDKGRIIHADLHFYCFPGKANSEYLLPHMAEVLNEEGRVKVNEFLQVEGYENIFAMGDITNLPEPKLAVTASGHQEIVATNIEKLAFEKTRQPYKNDLQTYTPYSKTFITLPIGPEDGYTQLPFGKDGKVVGAGFTKRMKSRHLNIEKSWKKLGLSKYE